MFNHSGNEVIRGCYSDAVEVVNQYVAGTIVDNSESFTAHNRYHQEGSG